MINSNFLDKLLNLDVAYKGTRYHLLVKECFKKYLDGDLDEARELFNRIPTVEKLLNDLVEKLKGKSVYSTVRKIYDGKVDNSWERMKGLLSLAVHACIECEHGNTEYKILLRHLYDTTGKLLFV